MYAWVALYCHPQVLAYQSAVVLPPYPPGKALGTFGGQQFGLGLKRTDTRCAFDATLGRTVPTPVSPCCILAVCTCH